MTTHLGESTILEIGMNYLDEICMIGYEIKIPLIQSMSAYLSGQNTYEQSKQTFLSVIGRTEPLDRLKEIVDMAEEPSSEPTSSSSPPSTFIQGNSNSHYNSDTDLDSSSGSSEPTSSSSPPSSSSTPSSSFSDSNPNGARKKTRSWSPQEDTKLLAGIYKYGIDNWTTISSFIGNGRTRAQCCQRWTRGLNPRVSKNLWSYEEDLKLVQLVYLYGDKSWTKIASMMGNRSDVQCRYHYRQVMRDMPPLLKNPFNFPHSSNLDKSFPHEYEEIKSAIEGILPSRYSMPQFSNGELDPSQQLFKTQNFPTPSPNFVSFAQNAQNQANFQQPASTIVSPFPTTCNVLVRPVLSLPSFDNDTSIFDVNGNHTIPEVPSIPSPNVNPIGNSNTKASSNMQIILNGELDTKIQDTFFTTSVRPKSNSLSSPYLPKIEITDHLVLQGKNSSPIPTLSSFCTPCDNQFDVSNNNSLFPLRRRDSAPPNSRDKRLKFPSPNELDYEIGCAQSFSGASQIDNFLNDFKK